MSQPMPALASSEAEPNGPHGEDPNIPLAVDLDGTLIFTDTLFEALADHLPRRPLWAIWQMIQLPFALAKVKARVQGRARIDVENLPVNDDVVAYCKRARSAGRKVWLVSASDQGIVSQIAERFDVFDRAVGSDGTTNNKGTNKGKLLEREAPQGFEYIGDSRADMKVWARAKAASIVGGGKMRRRAVERMGIRVAQTFERPRRGLGAWVKALHVHRWAKNALIFVPAIIAMKITDPATLLTLLLALPLVSALTSGAYILNDLVDLSVDRRHPTMKNRPFASGRLKLWQGFLAAPLLIIGSLAGGWLISPFFAGTLLAYLILAVAYSFKLKRIAFAGAMTLSLLYATRLLMGAVLTA